MNNQNNKVKVFYVISYYDFPLEGLAVYQDQIVYFEINQDTMYQNDMSWSVWKLSDDDINNELIEKRRFENMVGTGWSFDYDPVDRVFKNTKNYDYWGVTKEERETKQKENHAKRQGYKKKENLLIDNADLSYDRFGGEKVILPENWIMERN